MKGKLAEIIAQEKAAEEEQASRNILKSVQKAFKEAFLTLPPEDYQWSDLHTGTKRAGAGDGARSESVPADEEASDTANDTMPAQRQEAPGEEREFFNYPGPLFSAVVSPASVVVKVGAERGFRCLSRDKSRRPIEEGIVIRAKATITVSETLIERDASPGEKGGKGLPGYTFLRASGELWRSRYDEKNNLVVVNNGHRDYLYAAEKHARKLKYICRLFAKELVLANFPGFDSRELLERVIELSLYVEENLR